MRTLPFPTLGMTVGIALALIACEDGFRVSFGGPFPANQLVDPDAGVPDGALDPDDGVPRPDAAPDPDDGVPPPDAAPDPDDGVPPPDAAPDPDDGVPPDLGPDAGEDPDSGRPPLMGETIGEHVDRTCFNEGDDTPDELLDGISPQLVNAINCVQPGTLSDIPDSNWQMLDPRRAALVDGRAVDDLIRAIEERDAQLIIRWTYRDVALQHLFYLWTLKSCDFAARPGESNHQDGLAVDINGWDDWRAAMRMHGWEDNIPGDRPHFNYVRVQDVGLGPLSLVAFQALWNLNVPDRPLALTGNYDAATAQALSDSPLRGFPLSLCEDEGEPPTIGQAAFNGCAMPPSIVESLSVQIAEVLNCAVPGSLVPMNLCAGAGCIAVVGPPKPEFLEARTHAAVIAASQRAGEPVPLAWGWRDPATGWFQFVAQQRHGCGDPLGPAENPLSEGRAIELGPDASPAVEAALLEEGFVEMGDRFLVYPDGADLTQLGILAYQRLWNANRAERLGEDGRLGPATRAALDLAPPEGFRDTPCVAGGPDPGPAPIECIEGCFNQRCPGTYDFCAVAYGECAVVPCDVDDDCAGLQACDDPDRGSNPNFYCDDGRCRRR